MSKKHTYEYVKEVVENLGYELISKEYMNNKQKLTLMCNQGFYYLTTLDALNGGHLPRFVDKANIYSIRNIKLWCELNNKPFTIISTNYMGNKKNLKWKCLKSECGEIFESPWDEIFQGNGCGYCAGKQVGLSNCLATKNPELASEWHLIKNGKLTPYDVLCGSMKQVWWKCKKCGHEWKTYINNRNRGYGCLLCNESKGEKECKRIFNLNNIYYISQKEFAGLVGLGGKNLSYDFYLPNYNLLIEYQGMQHEKYIPGFHKSKKDFEKQQEHDKRKKEYTKNNNINLLEIWYYDFDNIEEIIIKKLNLNDIKLAI